MARVMLVGVVVGITVALVAILTSDPEPPVVGRLSEAVRDRPHDVPATELFPATRLWGLGDADFSGVDPMSGGLTLADLDGDGDLDLVAANGEALVFFWEGSGYSSPVSLGVDRAVAVNARDLDGDGWPDLVIARAGDADTIVWGGPWGVRGMAPGQTTSLAGGDPSAVLIPADFDGEGGLEVVRLSRGEARHSADVIWSATVGEPRSFTSAELPQVGRISLAGAIFDADSDGLLDIWVTRDVGWDQGGDSVYSRTDGSWTDMAAELGADLAIDGMGITLADVDGDAKIDAYISDIGDNELLVGIDRGFGPGPELGIGRIRPVGASDRVVSSSWGSGAADVNLDGRLDLVVTGGGFPDSAVRNKIAGSSIAEQEPPAILLGLDTGAFVDDWSSSGIELETVGRAMVLGDVDGDGDTDIVMMSNDGHLTALRNESTGASVTIDVDESCGDGLVISVDTAVGRFVSVIPGHTYGGSHARQVIVGTNGVEATISVRWPDGRSVVRQVPISNSRLHERVDC